MKKSTLTCLDRAKLCVYQNKKFNTFSPLHFIYAEKYLKMEPHHPTYYQITAANGEMIYTEKVSETDLRIALFKFTLYDYLNKNEKFDSFLIPSDLKNYPEYLRAEYKNEDERKKSEYPSYPNCKILFPDETKMLDHIDRNLNPNHTSIAEKIFKSIYKGAIFNPVYVNAKSLNNTKKDLCFDKIENCIIGIMPRTTIERESIGDVNRFIHNLKNNNPELEHHDAIL